MSERYEDYMKRRAAEEDRQPWLFPGLDNEAIDMVNHPPHYNHAGIECIEAIEAALTPEEFRGYCKGNNIKYTWRESYKNGDEDIKKARWYMDRLSTYHERHGKP
jgi:hypothetical protein